MTRHEALGGRTETPGRLDVGLLAYGDDLAPEEAHEARDEHDGNCDGSIVDVSTEKGCHRQGEDQGGEREEGVHRPHDHGVDRAPEEPGDQSEGDGDDGGQGHDLERHSQRDAGTPDQAAEDVTPEVVGPEPMRGGGPCVDRVDVLGVGSVRRDERGEDGGDDHDQQEDQSGDGPALMQEADPEPGAALGQLVGAVARLGDVGQPDEGVAGVRGAPRTHRAVLTTAGSSGSGRRRRRRRPG